MNLPYFRCDGCKRFIAAGYRAELSALIGAGLVLEGDVARGRSTQISAGAVLNSDEYWKTADDTSEDLHDRHRRQERVRAFLREHHAHQLSFGDCHGIVSGSEWLEWLSEDDDLLPRHFSETLQLSKWRDVEQHVGRMTTRPWWWDDHARRVAARRRFEELTQDLARRRA